jgi:hypothetical protein
MSSRAAQKTDNGRRARVTVALALPYSILTYNTQESINKLKDDEKCFETIEDK